MTRGHKNMPNPVIGLLNRFKLWRMQRRGDALVDVKPFFDTMIVSGTAVPPRKFFSDERHSRCI